MLKKKNDVALTCFEYAGEKGLKEVQQYCVRAYEEGLDCRIDEVKSLQWVEKLVEQETAEDKYFCAEKYHRKAATLWYVWSMVTIERALQLER